MEENKKKETIKKTTTPAKKNSSNKTTSTAAKKSNTKVSTATKKVDNTKNLAKAKSGGSTVSKTNSTKVVATAKKPEATKVVANAKKPETTKTVAGAKKVDTTKTAAATKKAEATKVGAKKQVTNNATKKTASKVDTKQGTKTNNSVKTASKENTIKEVPKNASTSTNANTIKVEKTPMGTVTVANTARTKTKKKSIIPKVIVIAIIVVLIAYFGTIFNKFMILNDLDKKLSVYQASTNYYEKIIPNSGSEIFSIEIYRKGDIVKKVMKSKDGIITIITTKNGRRTFYDTVKGDKVMTYSNETDIIAESSIVDLVSEGKWNNSFLGKIYSEKVDDIDCYVIDNCKSPNILYEEGTKSYKVYIEKGTGLVRQTVSVVEKDGVETETVQAYDYSFETVTDDDVKAPDINDYVINNNYQ